MIYLTFKIYSPALNLKEEKDPGNSLFFCFMYFNLVLISPTFVNFKVAIFFNFSLCLQSPHKLDIYESIIIVDFLIRQFIHVFSLRQERNTKIPIRWKRKYVL